MEETRSERFSATSWPLTGPPAETDEVIAPSGLTGGLVRGLLLGSLGEGGYLIPPRRELSLGIAAAALVELAFHGRVGADQGRLLVTDASPSGDGVVDPVLELLAARRRAPDVERSLEALALDWTILGRAGAELEARGLVRIERRSLYPLLMHRFHPVPPSRAAELRARLRSLHEGTAEGATPRDDALASLAATIGLLRTRRGGSASAGSATARVGEGQAAQVLPLVSQTLAAAFSRHAPLAARA